MAAPMKEEPKSPVSDEVPEFLDPLSPKFDPRRALYDSHTPVPVPDAKQFNNVAEFENYMHGKDAKTLQKKRDKPKEKLPGILAIRAAAQAKEAVRKAAIMAKNAGPYERSKTQERRNRNTTVFTRMEKATAMMFEQYVQFCFNTWNKVTQNLSANSLDPDEAVSICTMLAISKELLQDTKLSVKIVNLFQKINFTIKSYKKGPLSLLRKCVEERLRVIVVVRAAVAVRSRCRGYVIGFDKHFNMALMDVDEKYIRPIPKEKKEKNKHEEDGSSQEKILSEKTDRLTVQSSESRDRSHDRRTDSKHLDTKKLEKVPDLRDKLKLSKVSEAKSDSKVKSRETSMGRSSSKGIVHRSSDSESDLERSRSKEGRSSTKETSDQRSRSKDSKSSKSSGDTSERKHSRSQDDSGKKLSSGDSCKPRSVSKEKSERAKTSDEKMSEGSEIKRSRDFKDHYRNYMSDSNVFVQRQQQRLQENRSKSDGESRSESSHRKKNSGKELKRRFQPFWPLYKKWTESRCYAEYEILTRHVNQLFIRGDNVVSVSIADC